MVVESLLHQVVCFKYIFIVKNVYTFMLFKAIANKYFRFLFIASISPRIALTPLAPMNTPRCGVGAAVLDGKLIAMGKMS